MAEREPLPKGWWYCPKCHRDLPPEDVMWNETHDKRCGGCGETVFGYITQEQATKEMAREDHD